VKMGGSRVLRSIRRSVSSPLGGGEVVPRFVDLEVAVPHLSPAVW
jgi:hypothetical protein